MRKFTDYDYLNLKLQVEDYSDPPMLDSVSLGQQVKSQIVTSVNNDNMTNNMVAELQDNIRRLQEQLQQHKEISEEVYSFFVYF